MNPGEARRDSNDTSQDYKRGLQNQCVNSPEQGKRGASLGNPIDQQGTRRDSYGNPVEQQGLRKDSLKDSLGNSSELPKRNGCALQLIGDIVNGCSDMKVQRTDIDQSEKTYNSTSSCTMPGDTCTCNHGDDGSGEVTLCTSCSNNRHCQTEQTDNQDGTIDGRLNQPTFNNGEGSFSLFHILPWQDVIFTHVCRCLSLQDVFRLRATCRIGRDCVDEYFSVCPIVNLTRCSEKVTPSAFRLVTYSNFKLHTLILRQVKTWLTDDVLMPAFASSSHLKKVDLTLCSSITPRSVVALAGQAPGLHELYLRECPWLTKEAVIMVAQNCPSLVKLDLTGCWAVDDEAVVMVSICCRKLTFLSIAKIYGITDYSVRCLATNCTLLQHVNMHGCWRVTDGAVQLLGEYCQKLRLLQVKECREVTENSLARLRTRGVKTDVNPPLIRNRDAKNLMHKLKLQV